ncbi:MAG: AI-2E family transporter [Tissierellia bacterium]|nr:AI-2E family transporter [Tissierellia bacterium]MDD4046001.1 AI-2E family transporter [Tissierellia bacterium]
MKKNSFVILPVFIFYIAVFRFIYLENGLSLIIQVCFPIFAGILLAAVLNPVLVFIEKTLRIDNRYISVILTYLLVFLMISIVVKTITPNIINSIVELSKDIPKLYRKANSLLSLLSDELIVKIYLAEIVQKLSSILTAIINNTLTKVIDIFMAFANALLSIIISVYILMDKESIENWSKEFFGLFVGKKTANDIIKITHVLYRNVSNYISGKATASLFIALLIYIGSKYVIKCPYPVIDGMVIGITNMIPYFGTLIGSVPIVLINVLYAPQKGALLFILILILQQVESLIIDPKILSSQLSIKPLLVIISIIIGGGLFGPLGLFFAVPVAALIKSIVDVYMMKKLNKDMHIIDKS